MEGDETQARFISPQILIPKKGLGGVARPAGGQARSSRAKIFTAVSKYLNIQISKYPKSFPWTTLNLFQKDLELLVSGLIVEVRGERSLLFTMV